MKNLSIKVTDIKKHTAIGQIAINDFKENFQMSLDIWSVDDYKKQWQEGFERIKTYNNSVLITDITNQNSKTLIQWWVLYKEDNKIFIHNEMLGGKDFEKRLKKEPFNKETYYNFIDPRKTFTEEGHKISEWVIDLNDLDNI